jgi:LysM repeat protein
MKRKKKYGRWFILIIIFIAIITITVHAKQTSNYTYISYTVATGDTIWSISQQFNTFKDVREMVYEVKKINNSDSIIYPGQILKIPQKQ